MQPWANRPCFAVSVSNNSRNGERMRLPNLRIAHLAPKYPIIQGGMGVRISTAPLAAAVANCGGIGTLSAAEYHQKNRKTEKTDVVKGKTIARPYLYAPKMAEEIRRARSMTGG